MREDETGNPPVGTQVTCERGHRICEVVGPLQDWKTKTAFSAGLGNYTPGEHVAVPGTKAWECRCAQCGAPWIDERLNVDGRMGAKIHLATGWWP
jgi:hypothetical protein